jgi:hypothetical protein
MSTNLWQFILIATLLGLLNAQGQCPLTQYSDANGLCQPCPTNCATCDSVTFCTTCLANTFQVVANNMAMCRPCSEVQPGCSVCLSPTACQSCSIGFLLESSKCVTCSMKVSNCSSCETVNGTTSCLQCRYPYILVNNTCISATVDAITQGVQTVFTNTTNGTVAQVQLDSGSLVNAVLSPQGCNQYQVFVFNRCVRSIFQCIVYQ